MPYTKTSLKWIKHKCIYSIKESSDFSLLFLYFTSFLMSNINSCDIHEN